MLLRLILQNKPVLRRRLRSVTVTWPHSNGTGQPVSSHIDIDRSELFTQQEHVLDVVEHCRRRVFVLSSSRDDTQQRHEAVDNDPRFHDARARRTHASYAPRSSILERRKALCERVNDKILGAMCRITF